MRRRGLTLLEVLTVLAIILLVSAIALPVFASARRAAKIAQSTSNLRQIYLSTEIYRGEYEGNAFGTSFQMGLPPVPPADGLPILKKLTPPEAPHENSPLLGVRYWHYFVDPDIDGLVPTWSEYTQKYGSASVIYADPFFNPQSVPLETGDLYERFVIGISLDGSVRRKRDRGDWMSRTWWHDPTS